MSFPTGPSNYQLHIENGITFRYVSTKSRWELWDDSDATEWQLDSETHNRKAADSDLQVQITDNDSDIHDLKAKDSDQDIVINDNDSEINRRLDSEIHDRKAADSDHDVRITDNDSDILWLYNRDSDFTSAIDSDILALKSKDSDQDIIIADNDSEIRRMLDSEVHDRKADDSEIWHKLREVDSDLAVLFGRTDSDDLTLQDLRTHAEQMIDSERHDWQAADSDLTKDIDSDLHDLKAKDSDQDIIINDNDSEIRRMLDSEIHDRKAEDSDIIKNFDSDIHDLKAVDSDQWIAIFNNDSDILYLQDNAVKLRGVLDLTQNAPSHEEVKRGDLYISATDGPLTSDWGGLSGKYVKSRQAIIFADSDWRFLGGGEDSDQITNITNIYEYMAILPTDVRRRPHKLHYANETDTLFFEKDSEVFYIFEGEALYPQSPVFMDGIQRFIGSTPQNQVIITMSGAGPETGGNIKVFDKNGIQKTIGNLATVTNQVSEADGSKSFDGISNDSESVHVIVAYGPGETVEFGDSIVFTALSGHKSAVKCFDPNVRGFKRVSKIKLDLDSETIERKNNDSDIAYLMSIGLKYRGNLDMATEAPTSLPAKIGDLYFSYADGVIQDSEWGPLFGQPVNEGQAVVYTDSEWIFFGGTGSGGGNVSDSDLHNLRAKDSDLSDRISANDSDILALRHADSDLSDRISANDSDIAILDSDLNNGKTGIIAYEKLFIDGEYVTAAEITATTFNGVFNTFDAEGIGSAWLFFGTTTWPTLNNDTTVIVADGKVVGSFVNPNDLTKEVIFGEGVYRQGLNSIGNFQTSINGAARVGLNGHNLIYSDGGRKLISLTERNYTSKARGDSDTYQNAQTIVELFDILDSEIHHVEDKFNTFREDTPFVKYDNDSEITVNGIKFSEDSEYAALRWNDNDKTLDIVLSNGPVLQVGQEVMFFAKADEDISNGDVVMFAGAQGDHLLMRKADTTIAGFRPEWIMGVATSDITNNQFGYVTQIGKVRGLDTSAYTEGALLWMDPNNAGGLLDSEPPWPIRPILIAATTRSHATEGSIYVRVTTGTNLGDIHDVQITEPAEGGKHNQIIRWDSDTHFWTNQTIDADYGTF